MAAYSQTVTMMIAAPPIGIAFTAWMDQTGDPSGFVSDLRNSVKSVLRQLASEGLLRRLHSQL